jgi:hypothetical protein
MNGDVFGMVSTGVLIGLMIGGGCALSKEADLLVCERTIQYQFDKTPEQVKAVIEQERKREGR